MAWLATYVCLAKNGVELDPPNEEAYDFVIALADGTLDDIGAIAGVLRSFAVD